MLNLLKYVSMFMTGRTYSNTVAWAMNNRTQVRYQLSSSSASHINQLDLTAFLDMLRQTESLMAIGYHAKVTSSSLHLMTWSRVPKDTRNSIGSHSDEAGTIQSLPTRGRLKAHVV
ncbi:UNVERIFIED_CONTAM: hypothetical protein Slati_1358000 [Sesamum latifolium]|uniref:Uncharacterized protein n=1 Tax=Sesamum latifolium TaxID=2727402 RepID=A0AAW2XI76_9LAMI